MHDVVMCCYDVVCGCVTCYVSESSWQEDRFRLCRRRLHYWVCLLLSWSPVSLVPICQCGGVRLAVSCQAGAGLGQARGDLLLGGALGGDRDPRQAGHLLPGLLPPRRVPGPRHRRGHPALHRAESVLCLFYFAGSKSLNSFSGLVQVLGAQSAMSAGWRPTAAGVAAPETPRTCTASSARPGEQRAGRRSGTR